VRAARRKWGYAIVETHPVERWLPWSQDVPPVLVLKARSLKVRRIILFLMIGGFSALCTLALRGLLTLIIPFEAAVATAHVAGMTIAFSLDRLFVFTEYQGRLFPAYLRFFSVNLISLALATIVSSLLYRFIFPLTPLGHDADYLAHFFGLAATAIPSYFGHRAFSFSNRKTETAETTGAP
jgi:putative flippase GtrA